jgi:glutathione synthase/RimK-type ligase-like ATP-grasp enzyme
MEKSIVVGKNGRPSMMKVYENMNNGSLITRLIPRRQDRRTFYRTYRNNDIERRTRSFDQPSLNNRVVVRWGTREEFDTSGAIVYNKSLAIQNASDKKLMRKLLAENGVKVPKSVTPHNENHADYPIIARPSSHSKGSNFVVLLGRAEFIDHYHRNERHGWYYSAFYNKEHEYRFHVAHGKVLGIMQKPRPNNGSIAWNRAINDDGFEYVNWDRLNDVPHLAEGAYQSTKAVEALGLDFGGVDVMCKGDDAVVIEVNTAPSVSTSEYMSERWAKYLDWLFKSEDRREHFKPENGERYGVPRNWIFYNNQLAE